MRIFLNVNSPAKRLTNFVTHELVTVNFRNVERHLGLGRPGGCKGKDGYQGDADALPWHNTLLSRNRHSRKATHRLYRFCQPLGRPRAGVDTAGPRWAARLPRFVQKSVIDGVLPQNRCWSRQRKETA